MLCNNNIKINLYEITHDIEWLDKQSIEYYISDDIKNINLRYKSSIKNLGNVIIDNEIWDNVIKALMQKNNELYKEIQDKNKQIRELKDMIENMAKDKKTWF